MVNDLFPRSVMVLTVGGHHHESSQQRSRSRSQWQWRSLITQDTYTPPVLAWDSFYTVGQICLTRGSSQSNIGLLLRML